MEKKNRVVKLSEVIILTFVLMFSVNIAIAGNPPPYGFHPAGPAIIAELTFTPVNYYYDDDNDPETPPVFVHIGVAFEGTGTCGGSPVIIPHDESLVDEHLFEAVNEDTLLDFIVTFPSGFPQAPGGGAADCIPIDKEGYYPPGMMIRAVTDFDEGDGNYKWAKVILLFIIPK